MGPGYVNGVFIEIDNNGKAVKIEKVHIKYFVKPLLFYPANVIIYSVKIITPIN